jgi:hypothetical protein
MTAGIPLVKEVLEQKGRKTSECHPLCGPAVVAKVTVG